ncbi:MAG: hypothetical protein HYV07_00535 [Deltaproteobacteria bacterium]|nr:hypothetical protein [Deltaproteobacteria bacterium]
MSDAEDKPLGQEGEQIASDALVVPQELTGPGVNTPAGWNEESKVTPQELTSPGTQPDFRAPQAYVPTQVVRPRRSSTSSGIEIDTKSRPLEAQRALLSELHESRRFFRRVAGVMTMVAMVATVGVIGLVMNLNRSTSEISELKSRLEELERTRAVASERPGAKEPEEPEPALQEPKAAEREEPSPESRTKPRTKDHPKERSKLEPSKPAPKEEPKPEPKPEPKSEHSPLQKQLAKLRAAPGDGATFDGLAKALKSAAASQPEERKRAVLSAVNAAELSYDVDGLARGLEILMRK